MTMELHCNTTITLQFRATRKNCNISAFFEYRIIPHTTVCKHTQILLRYTTPTSIPPTWLPVIAVNVITITPHIICGAKPYARVYLGPPMRMTNGNLPDGWHSGRIKCIDVCRIKRHADSTWNKRTYDVPKNKITTQFFTNSASLWQSEWQRADTRTKIH